MQFPKAIFSDYQGPCHCQGLAVDKEKGYIYYSFTTKLVKSDLDGNIIGSVDGLIGHLGCIDFCEGDGRVYGSLEFKNDIIGKEILKNLNIENTQVKNAFYCVIFDVDKIDRMNMDAEADGIMKAVYLPEVVSDFEGDGIGHPHKYGCSGIDGTAWGPMWGRTDGKEYLNICYGVYGSVDRTDNDYQIILTLDAENWWDTVAQPLNQSNMHTSGAYSVIKCFVKTGSTNWGVQNLEYDDYLKHWILCVYRGSKPQYVNYDMYIISAQEAPKMSQNSAYGEEIYELSLYNKGIYFPYGSTGIYAFGDGRYYFSRPGYDKEKGQYTNVRLYRASDSEADPFIEVT